MDEHKSRRDISRARARALAEARELSLLFGHDVMFGCPVLWESTTCYAVVLGPWGHDVDDPNPQAEAVEWPRLLGAFVLREVWDLVDHSGPIPDDEERAAADEYFTHVRNEHRFSLSA